MQNTLKALRGLTLAAIILALPTRALAQNEGRFTGTVLDSSGAFVPGATVVGQEPEDRRGAHGHGGAGWPVPRGQPETVAVHDPGDLRQLPAARIHRDDDCRGPGVSARSDAHPRGRVRDGHGHRAHQRHRPELGAHRRQRQRARGPGAPRQRPADVAAAAAGARIAERGHRHVAGHPVQRPRRRAERDPLRRHRRLRDHRRRRRAT